MGLIDDQLVVNPAIDDMEESLLDLVVAGTRGAIASLNSPFIRPAGLRTSCPKPHA